jgi:hypothetical protein
LRVEFEIHHQPELLLELAEDGDMSEILWCEVTGLKIRARGANREPSK